MKGTVGKYIMVILAGLTIIFTGCDEENLGSEEKVVVRPLTQEETFLVESSNAFALDMLKQTNAIQNENISFSPISAGAALGIVGNTLSEEDFEKFKITVGLPNLSRAKINKAFYELSTMAPLIDEHVEVKFSNSLWTKYQISQVNDVYSKILAYYNTDVLETYASKSFDEKFIDKWISSRSDFAFTDIKNFSGNSLFQIINLSQFKGSLFNGEKALPFNASFLDTDGRSHHVVMNHFSDKNVEVMEYENIKVLELPIGGGEFLLEVILANNNKNINYYTNLDVISTSYYNGVILPDIKSTYEFTFDRSFEQYEVNNYVLTGISHHFPESQWPSSSTFLNKSTVTIANDRKSGDQSQNLVAMADDKSFVVDKPFYFLIKERNSGLILFEGMYSDPEN